MRLFKWNFTCILSTCCSEVRTGLAFLAHGKQSPHLKLLWSGEHVEAAATWLWADLPRQCQEQKKAKTRILIFKNVLPSWLWPCPFAECSASPGEWHTQALVLSMGIEWATVSHQFLRLLYFLELSEHIELCQWSQTRNDCLNENCSWDILSVLSATCSRQHFFIYAEGTIIHVWWIKKTLASFAVQDHHYLFCEPVLKRLTFTNWSPVTPFLQ